MGFLKVSEVLGREVLSLVHNIFINHVEKGNKQIRCQNLQEHVKYLAYADSENISSKFTVNKLFVDEWATWWQMKFRVCKWKTVHIEQE